MTAVPAVEKTETAKCNTCERDCVQLCTQCGRNFCKKHMLRHLEKCGGFKALVHSLLRDDFKEIIKQVAEAMLKSI
ncbi:hypothetical protein [Nitrosotalea sinensis]|uniref:hypothetical protein n=1 Tax=Nitrosotalea sinensis TaxID=1499975 RepID=UPI000C302836|nr:hypothetical protein [Candidatus Nitrosotalea sinensis]